MPDPDHVLAAHDSYGLPLAFTRDAAELVTGGFDGNVTVWSTGAWTEEASVRAHDQSVNCGAATAGETLVTGSTDHTLKAWDRSLSGDGRTMDGHQDTVAGLAAHPTRELVASASYDATVRLWDLDTDGEPVVLSGHGRNVTGVAFLPDGEHLASGGLGDELVVWTLDGGEPFARLGGHGPAVSGVAVGGDDALWTVGYGGTVHRWSTEDWTERESFDLPEDATPSGLAVEPVEGTLAVTRDNGVLVYEPDGTILDEHETSIEGIYSPCYAPDGAWLAVGGADGDVRLYA